MLTASSAIAQEKVNIGLDLTISGLHAGWLVAQKMGYFKDQGLDVTITRGYGSGDTVQQGPEGRNRRRLPPRRQSGDRELRGRGPSRRDELPGAGALRGLLGGRGRQRHHAEEDGRPDLGRPAHRRLHRHPAGGVAGWRRRRQQGQHAAGAAGRALPDAGGQHHPGDRQLSRQGLLHPPGAGEVRRRR